MNQIFDFHGTKMMIKASTSDTNGSHTIIHAIHPPNVGPALHLHPRGSESFYIIEGEYKFVLGNKTLDAKKNDVVLVPKDTPHKFTTGTNGGTVLIISPPELENYFIQVSELLQKGTVTWNTESDIARKFGQVFLENTNHW